MNEALHSASPVCGVFTSAEVQPLLEHPALAKDFARIAAPGVLAKMWQDSGDVREAWQILREGGAAVGCVLVETLPLTDGTRQALVRLAVHPDRRRRGLGSALLEQTVRRLRLINNEQSGPRISLLALFAVEPCADAAAFAARHGFDSVRQFHFMEREAAPVPEPVWPAGFTVRPFDGSEEMLAAWCHAYNAGMASHFRFTPATFENCRAIAAGPDFAPDHVQIAFAREAPAGLVRTSLHRADDITTGSIEILAVAPEHRGLSLGRALFRAGLRHLLTQGVNRLRLNVDAASAHAHSIYRREGFATVSTRRHWERAIS